MASRSDMFLSLVKNRKTTYEFGPKPVPKSSLSKILEAGRWAPSSWNTQPWQFIVVTNKQTITKLNRICPFGGFHHDPAVIVALTIPSKLLGGEFRGTIDGKIGRTEALLSISLPSYNMCLMAHTLKVSSALLTPEPGKASAILNLAKGDFCPVMVGLGYEKKGAFHKGKERKSLNELVSYLD